VSRRFVVLLLGLVVFCVAAAFWSAGERDRRCIEQGGHIHHQSPVALCLTPDGRVMEP
jgi:hypothetical protein